MARNSRDIGGTNADANDSADAHYQEYAAN